MIMDLETLKQIEKERAEELHAAESAKNDAKAIAAIRTNGTLRLEPFSAYKWEARRYEAMSEAFEPFRADVCRVAEMRLLAKARSHKVRARLLQSQLDAYLTEPDVAKEQ